MMTVLSIMAKIKHLDLFIFIIGRDGILRRLAIFFLVSDFVKFKISLQIMKNKDD
jgi:hypothetical protein